MIHARTDRRPGRTGVACLLIAGLLLGAAASADERILGYHSEIFVQQDGAMRVTETIRVRAEGRQIRRGIFRDFPTDYRDRFGNRYKVDFEVVGVTRDDVPEPWHAEKHANGVRVYVGSANVFLEPGIYRYAITYRTDRQLGFFEDHDELYWNVTGNGWDFPIDEASATVTLQYGTLSDGVSIEGYTGVFGSTAQNVAGEIGDGQVHIATTRPLGPREGLTLVASWPRGYVTEPTRGQRLRWLLMDNRGLLIALVGLAAAVLYLYVVWHRFGRDPKPGVIFPHYEPPGPYSPASARYVMEMGYDPRVFAAAVINLAVKGLIEITEDDGDYTLRRNNGVEATLAPGEWALMKRLFRDGPIIELDDKNHRAIGGALKAHKRALKRDYEKVYFFTNTPLAVPAIIWLGVAAVVIGVVDGYTPMAVAVLVVAAIFVVFFTYILKAATPRGRRLMDKLEGFKLYLEVAEKDDLNLRNPPEKTPELFERYLPFALALAVEQDWAEQFAEVFARLRGEGQGGYRPRWYRGNFSTDRLGSFTSDVGKSLTSAIASSSTPPGSSSGGGGGGFSGGGGGGGGGGGW